MEPTSRGRTGWTLIPSFAERRMAAGLPLSLGLGGSPRAIQRAQDARDIYKTLDAAFALRQAQRLGIDYLYLDDWDRAHFTSQGLAKFEAHPELFVPAFRHGDVEIYSVVPR